MKTSVLCSSIFFIADSVFSGETIVLNWSIRGTCGIDLRGYLGTRARRRVFGRRKETECRTLRATCACVPVWTAFFAALALASLADALGVSLRFVDFVGAMVRISLDECRPVLCGWRRIWEILRQPGLAELGKCISASALLKHVLRTASNYIHTTES